MEVLVRMDCKVHSFYKQFSTLIKALPSRFAGNEVILKFQCLGLDHSCERRIIYAQIVAHQLNWQFAAFHRQKISEEHDWFTTNDIDSHIDDVY